MRVKRSALVSAIQRMLSEVYGEIGAEKSAERDRMTDVEAKRGFDNFLKDFLKNLKSIKAAPGDGLFDSMLENLLREQAITSSFSLTGDSSDPISKLVKFDNIHREIARDADFINMVNDSLKDQSQHHIKSGIGNHEKFESISKQIRDYERDIFRAFDIERDEALQGLRKYRKIHQDLEAYRRSAENTTIPLKTINSWIKSPGMLIMDRLFGRHRIANERQRHSWDLPKKIYDKYKSTSGQIVFSPQDLALAKKAAQHARASAQKTIRQKAVVNSKFNELGKEIENFLLKNSITKTAANLIAAKILSRHLERSNKKFGVEFKRGMKRADKKHFLNTKVVDPESGEKVKIRDILQAKWHVVHYIGAFAANRQNPFVGTESFVSSYAGGKSGEEYAGVGYHKDNNLLGDNIARGVDTPSLAPKIGTILDGYITGLYSRDAASSTYKVATAGGKREGQKGQFVRYAGDWEENIRGYKDVQRPSMVYDLEGYAKDVQGKEFNYNEAFIDNWSIGGVVADWQMIKEEQMKNIEKWYGDADPALQMALVYSKFYDTIVSNSLPVKDKNFNDISYDDFKKYFIGMMAAVMRLDADNENYPPEDPEFGATYETYAEEMFDDKEKQSKAGGMYKDPTKMRYSEALLRDLISELLK